jgi:hypothetical protein
MRHQQKRQELTEQELLYYSNYALIEMCEDPGHNDWVSITNYHEGNNYIIYDGKFICFNCRKLH